MNRNLVRAALLLALAWPAGARGADPVGTTLELHWDVQLADFQDPIVTPAQLSDMCKAQSENLVAKWRAKAPYWKLIAPKPPVPGAPLPPRLVIEVSAASGDKKAAIAFRLVAHGVNGLPPEHELHTDWLFKTGEYATSTDGPDADAETRLKIIALQLHMNVSAVLLEKMKSVPIADGLYHQKVADAPVWAVPLRWKEFPVPLSDAESRPRFRLACERETPTGPTFRSVYARAIREYAGPPPGLIEVEHESGYEDGLKVLRVFLDSPNPPPLRSGTEQAP